MRKQIILLTTLLLMGSVVCFGQKRKKVDVVRIKTAYGEFLVYLYDRTPIHKANFLALARSGFYDSTTFHRVIDKFMIQGGDPNSKDNNPANDGSGGPPYTGKPNTQRDPDDTSKYTIPAEIKPGIYHRRGSIAAARTGNPEKRSSGSQFYIVTGKVFSEQELDNFSRRGLTLTEEQKKIYTTVGGTPHLDGQYTVFGEVISGINYADTIARVPKGPGDRPLRNVTMSMKVERMKLKKLRKNYNWSVPQGEPGYVAPKPDKKADKKQTESGAQ